MNRVSPSSSARQLPHTPAQANFRSLQSYSPSLNAEWESVDLVALEAQVRNLEAQKSELSAQLNNLRSTQQAKNSQVSKGLNGRSLSEEEILANASARAKKVSALQLENSYRMTGITPFVVKDPAPTGETYLGIRVEAFSKAQFLAPIYVIFKKTSVVPKDGQYPSGSETLSLYKATVPAYFNLSSLQSQYLPINASIDSQDLEGLMRELRRRVILHGQRGDMLEGLRKASITDNSASAETISDSLKKAQIRWDEARENVAVEYNLPKAKVKGTLRLDETGKVLKCALREFESGEESKGVRLRRLERMLRVEGLQVLERILQDLK